MHNGTAAKQKNMDKTRKAAFDCFLKHSIRSTTLQMVSDRAGLDLRTVRRYYKNHAEMVYDVMRVEGNAYMENLFAEVYWAVPEQCSALERLIAFGRSLFAVCNREPAPWLLINELELYLYENKAAEPGNKDGLPPVHLLKPDKKQLLHAGIRPFQHPKGGKPGQL